MEIQLLCSVSFSSDLCALSSEKTFLEFVTNRFSATARSYDITTHQELLHLNTLRETSELYFTNGSKDYHVCEHIASLYKNFIEEKAWNNVFLYLQSKTDKYLVFGSTRAISAIMYNFPMLVLEQRLSSMLKTLLNTEEVTTQNNLFDLLISLFNRHGKVACNPRDSQCGHVKKQCKVSPVEDIFSCLCLTLSSHWTSLLQRFLETGYPNINFLLLWKILSEKNLNEHHSSVFLNENLVVNFLSVASRLPTVALKLYVDIISQIFCSSLKSNSWKCSRPSFLEANVSTAMNMNCLNWLPLQEVSSNFCTITDRNQRLFQAETVELNVTAKKVIFVIFNLLCEFTNAESLSEVLDQLLEFTVTHTINRTDESMHSWAIDLFIEYDDLLFGVIFTSLKIYCKLKDLSLQDCHSKHAPFLEKLNPHKTFVKFIQQIGYDHNELLSFLLSEETCCLVYLLWYLKLLLGEWTEFVMAHEILFTEKHEKEPMLNGVLSNSTKSSRNLSETNLVSHPNSSISDEESELLSVEHKETEISYEAHEILCTEKCEKELLSKCIAKLPKNTKMLFTEKCEKELHMKSTKNFENLSVRKLVSYPGSSDEETELLSVELEIPETELLSFGKKETEISDKIPELLSVEPKIPALLSVEKKETEISDSSDKIPELLSVDPEIPELFSVEPEILEPELLSVEHKETEISYYLKKRALKTLSVLVALERGIQKLVVLKEFPYNVKPLMKLLKRCSDKCLLLK